MNDQQAYHTNSHYLLISSHLKDFDTELRSIIQRNKFIDQKNAERLIKEYLNKLYCILYSLEYALTLKDSLVISLISKYVYEIFVDFQYIFGNPGHKEERVGEFFAFEANPEKRDWTSSSRSERAEEISDNFLKTHKSYYSRLNNNAHPSIHSLYINRRGIEFEQWFIFSSVLMVISTILIVLKDPETLKYIKFDSHKLNKFSVTNSNLLQEIAT